MAGSTEPLPRPAARGGRHDPKEISSEEIEPAGPPNFHLAFPLLGIFDIDLSELITPRIDHMKNRRVWRFDLSVS